MTRRAADWVTLSNNRRVELTDEGRIERGLPEDFHGVHVQDLSLFGQRRSEYRDDVAYCQTVGDPSVLRNFPTKEDAIEALLAVNPDLRDLVESEWSAADAAYFDWVRDGRRGRKPPPAVGGTFDALNERLNLRGGHRVSGWREALYRVTPNSRRWDEFRDRLWILEEVVGFPIQPPEAAIAWEAEDQERERCVEVVTDDWDEYVDQARTARVVRPEEEYGDEEEDLYEDEVPF